LFGLKPSYVDFNQQREAFMEDQLTGAVDQVQEVAVNYGLEVLGGIIILIVGWVVAKWAGSLVKKQGTKREWDETLLNFFSRAVTVLIMVFTVVAVLNQFGVETASIIGVLAAASLAVGLALQGTLSNFASGIMLLLFRPFQVGDFVEIGGQTGTVADLGIFATELTPLSGEYTYIPNGKIWGEVITNFTRNSTRRMKLDVGIAYDDDHELAREVMLRVARDTGKVLEDPEPFVAMTSHGDSAIVMSLYCWTNTPDYYPTIRQLTEEFKEAFDQEGLNFPFPQRDVHLFQESA
jgi:small conductance mechanosensitive channel